jgi:hypothetical protein
MLQTTSFSSTPATPVQALQRTRSAFTAAASDHRLSTTTQPPRQLRTSLSLGSLGASSRHMKSLSFIFVACASLLLGCVASAAPEPDTLKQHPSWTLSPAAKRKLAFNASKLKIGDTYDAAIAALGKPTEDRQLIPKGSNISHGRSLRYQVVIWEAGLVNELYDEHIYVVLDTQNIIKKISIRITLTE